MERAVDINNEVLGLYLTLEKNKQKFNLLI